MESPTNPRSRLEWIAIASIIAFMVAALVLGLWRDSIATRRESILLQLLNERREYMDEIRSNQRVMIDQQRLIIERLSSKP